eukprot:869030-Prymnesium_polylepis.1
MHARVGRRGCRRRRATRTWGHMLWMLTWKARRRWRRGWGGGVCRRKIMRCIIMWDDANVQQARSHGDDV